MSIQAEQDYHITQVAAIVDQGISIPIAVLAVDSYLYLLDCACDPQTNSLCYTIAMPFGHFLLTCVRVSVTIHAVF